MSIEMNESRSVPVILIKSRNTPSDITFDRFTAIGTAFPFEPVFAPVIGANYVMQSIIKLEEHIIGNKFEEETFNEGDPNAGYGGLIFTSALAAEAFVFAATRSEESYQMINRRNMPMYCVGESTAQSLRSLEEQGPDIVGQDSNKAEFLAYFIQGDYPQRCENRQWPTKAKLLFCAGEEHKKHIPNILDDPKIPEERRISVEVLPVYYTYKRPSFKAEFMNLMRDVVKRSSIQWVVFYSQKGCKEVLEILGRLDFEGYDRGRALSRAGSTYIATIGTETRDELWNSCRCEPDVVGQGGAKGVRPAIEEYMQEHGLS